MKSRPLLLSVLCTANVAWESISPELITLPWTVTVPPCWTSVVPGLVNAPETVSVDEITLMLPALVNAPAVVKLCWPKVKEPLLPIVANALISLKTAPARPARPRRCW